MDINMFYDFGSRLVGTTAQVHSESLRNEEPLEGNLDDEYHLILGRYDTIDFPVVFRQDSGKYFRDMLDTGWPALYLISDKMKRVLEENALKGWQTYPVVVYDKKGNEIVGYHGFSVTGRCGPPDYSRCKIIEKRLVPEGPIGKYYIGKHIDLDTWDGSDFFVSLGSFGINVTEKAMQVMKDDKLTNVAFENLAEYELDEFTVNLNKKKRMTESAEYLDFWRT